MFTYILCTLFDITVTEVLSYKAELDNLKQRNQQRNWQVVSQLMQLRTQPIEIIKPVVRTLDVKKFNFGSNYSGTQKVWVTWWSVEPTELYGNDLDPIAILLKDFDQIPMLMRLDESVNFALPILMTQGLDCNICFYTRESWDNTVFKIDFDIAEAK